MHEQPCDLLQVNYIPKKNKHEWVYYSVGVLLLSIPLLTALGIHNLQEIAGTTTILYYGLSGRLV